MNLENPNKMSIVNFKHYCEQNNIQVAIMKKIWMLLRGTSRNILSSTETILIVHLINLQKTRKFLKIPDALDPDLLELVRNFQEKYPLRVPQKVLTPSKPMKIVNNIDRNIQSKMVRFSCSINNV
jgi:hypothetical protein